MAGTHKATRIRPSKAAQAIGASIHPHPTYDAAQAILTPSSTS
jgi:hypothetical protein